MGRISTQPELAQAIPLRSGFFALPLNNGKTHLFARLHHGLDADVNSDDKAEQGDAQSTSKQLFVTALPAGVGEKGLKTALAKVFGDDNKVKSVRFLPIGSSKGYTTLLEQDLLMSQLAGEGGAPEIAPLFDASEAASTSTATLPPQSAIVSFTSAPSLPPRPYPSATPLTLPVAPSFLAVSAARHALARPHRSVVIAHVDEWMRAYDARKLASAPAGYSAEAAAAAAAEEAKKAKGKKNKGRKGKAVDVGPLPGSAAEALARHAAARAKYNDASFNPDAADEGEWQTVSRGGRHGKSLLPTGVVPSVGGYGGVSVKVAGKKRGRLADAETPRLDAGVRKIVGDGFYSFRKNEGRRLELENLKARFEQDKARVDRMRRGGGGDGRQSRGGYSAGGHGGGERRQQQGGRFKPY
ncbi:hypothetical protein JCM10908_003162 [Rhodotorula pacifica]|uniref:uncharacterized protein n=1 Tax=Rhodotorula pacifica TaxID=1495444 RepID=UPI003171F4E2